MLRLLAIVAYSLIGACEPNCAVVSSHVSPDGRFEIAVCRVETSGAMMPGQSGDAPGRVMLRDRRSKRVLQTADLEMVQLMDEVTWSPDRVHVRLIADWALPTSSD